MHLHGVFCHIAVHMSWDLYKPSLYKLSLWHAYISSSLLVLQMMYVADLLQRLCSSTKLLAKRYP